MEPKKIEIYEVSEHEIFMSNIVIIVRSLKTLEKIQEHQRDFPTIQMCVLGKLKIICIQLI